MDWNGLEGQAIPLSKATVFGAAVAFWFGNLRGPIPEGHKRHFAYDVVSIMEPTTLLVIAKEDWATVVRLVQAAHDAGAQVARRREAWREEGCGRMRRCRR